MKRHHTLSHIAVAEGYLLNALTKTACQLTPNQLVAICEKSPPLYHIVTAANKGHRCFECFSK